MTLSVVIPYYEDPAEAQATRDAVRNSTDPSMELEFLAIDIAADGNLPRAKNQGMAGTSGDFVLFLYSGLFPKPQAVEILASCLAGDPHLAAVAGRWSNAEGKLEVGYNVRRFPTFAALVLDLLLLNKLFPKNAATRRYKMHDFDHLYPILPEHATDCVFMVRRAVVQSLGGFDERLSPGWFDQLEFCHNMQKADRSIRYEPAAQFISNEKPPLINRLVRDHYPAYRKAERLYIRNHFGPAGSSFARLCVAIGMIQRILFSVAFPRTVRRWCMRNLRSYVSDEYVRDHRSAYWSVLKTSLRGK